MARIQRISQTYVCFFKHSRVSPFIYFFPDVVPLAALEATLGLLCISGVAAEGAVFGNVCGHAVCVCGCVHV